MSDLTGKRALVTGASRGIGAAIAVDLATRGADVAITYQQSAGSAATVTDKIRSLGRRAVAIQADSADAAAVTGSIAETVSQIGGLDILVNNAGVLYSAPLTETSLEQIDHLIAVNIRATVLASQAAIAYLPDGGRIVSLGSCLAERVAIDYATVYSMSKSALLSFTRGLARELGPRGITVNLVHPGPTDTDMNPADGVGADELRALMALGRYASVDDIASAVAFLVSPAARNITGTGITVDSGMNA
ncbi:SDR family oxidoreductase [Mycobacterium sp. CBMA293]|nr:MULTISPECIES: SDR family oxidoreductase [unclassified Mycolicibacterium]MUL57590.1 SDR family oxidoreductase [Mycolicibacterium sp. CBMA 335]MUL70630.1 SDR family oxidoreductase [Mycolicibacterium sp. CBMA 311]MUM08309.1 oxidoreductase [Mycolicibacterium sp. CBMA 213]MUM12239.1 SDR family oxidoreductase [Mycolicibacterium sp. CBMA 293]MUL48242.1 SDR family oxidoreductase [Mycolicibacterium sp. CBMA 360]